jgi:phage/plasmid-associated DNA primase
MNEIHTPNITDNSANFTSEVITQSGTETPKAQKQTNKKWTGRVSLDNHQYQNKPQKSDAGGINNRICRGATDTDEDTLIEKITSGCSWSPTTFNGKRDKEHFLEMSALVADFDEGFKNIDQILKRAEEHNLKFSFVHKSFSHTLERPKYRGVFLLDLPITNYKDAKSSCEYIKRVFKDFVDQGAAEPCRLFYGGRSDSLVFHNQGHVLSLSWLDKEADAFTKVIAERKKPAKSQLSPKKTINREKKTDGGDINKSDSIYRAGTDEGGLLIVNNSKDHRFIEFDSDDYVEILSVENFVRLLEIKTALEVLDTRICNDYDTWLKIGMALHDEGSTNGDLSDAMEELFYSWSRMIPEKYDEEEAKVKWDSFSECGGNRITINTLFHYARQEVDNVKNLARKIYPLVDNHYTGLETNQSSELKSLNPYFVDSTYTFQTCLAKVLKSQDYISLNGNCYKWTGTHWGMVNNEAMMTHIANESQKFHRPSRQKEMLYTFATERDVNSGLNFFKFLHNRNEINESNTHLIAFDNGTLDINTNVLSPHHNQNDYLTFKIMGDYLKDAKLPDVAQNFLISAFGEELIPYIRAVCRMYLDSTFPYGKFVHVIGPSGSGKGTFIRLLLSMLSPSSIGSGNDLTCFNKPDKIMQELSGKSIYALPDMGGFTSNCTGFYELVDNGILSGRNLFSSHTIAKSWGVRFIVGSVAPLKVGGSSDGWSRRVLQLPTKKREGKPDIYLEKNLKDASALIASWALQMSKEEALELILNASGNEIIRQSILEAAIFGDSIKQFLDQCVFLTGRSTDCIAISKLHEYYKVYCVKKGYKAVAIGTFSSTIKSDLEHLYLKRTTIKTVRRPSSLGYIQVPEGLFSETIGHSPAEYIKYNSEHEIEGNLNNLLKFNPNQVNSDPNQAEIETAIMFYNEEYLKNIHSRCVIPIMKLRKIYKAIDESDLNEGQRELLVKMRNHVG